MFINEIKENSKNQNNTKDLNCEPINKHSIYKQPFSLDKIKKFIYNRKQFQNLIKSENSDGRLLKLQKILKKKLSKINPESQRLIHKNDLLSKIMKQKKNNSEVESIKSISDKLSRNKEISLEKYNSEYNLPKLNIFKLIKRREVEEKTTITLFHNNNNVNLKKREDFFIPSDLITGRDLFQNQSRIIKISSFVNKSNNNEINEENKKILDINEINNKFNLKLNLGKNKHKESKIFKGKKYTIFGMLNKLFQYYSSEKNNKINNEKNNNINNNQDNNYINYPILNNSDFINWNESTDMIKKNINKRNSSNMINSYNSSDSSNLYITKLNVSKKPLFRRNSHSHLNISQFIKERCSISEMGRKNKEIIDNNRKVCIDCLFSKFEEKINIKKIFYKYLGKSIYEYEKDPSYNRIKAFDKKINKLLKKNVSF